MRRTVPFWETLGLGALVAACGGGGQPGGSTPVAVPSLAAGTVLTVVSGETDAPVPGAALTVAGRTYTSNAAGQVVLDQALALAPAPMQDAVAGGFLDRQTLLRSPEETRLSLWPRATPTGIDEAFTAGIVYTASECPFNASGRPPLELHRWARSVTQAFIVFGAELAADEEVWNAHQEGVARLNEATRGAVTHTVTRQAPGTGVVFEMRLDPGDPACPGPEPFRAVTYTNLNGASEIVGGWVGYCSPAAARLVNLVTHELGHTFGLKHSPDRRDVMYCTSGRPNRYSARESLTMALMLRRRAGNRFPDNDRQSSASADRPRTERVACAGS